MSDYKKKWTTDELRELKKWSKGGDSEASLKLSFYYYYHGWSFVGWYKSIGWELLAAEQGDRISKDLKRINILRRRFAQAMMVICAIAFLVSLCGLLSVLLLGVA